MYRIRKAGLHDMEQLATLFDGYRVFYGRTSDKQNAALFLSERIQNNESVIFVSETDEKILTGFVQLYPIFSSTRMKRLWLLNDLFVKPEFRGQHISIQLLESAKEMAKDTGSCGLVLETANTNTIGNQLYPRAGFVLDTEHNYYYWNRE